MDWVAFDIYSLLRFCGALAILLAVYYLLFDRKARFVHCRYYLLSIVSIAAVVAIFQIPVYPSARTAALTPELSAVAAVHGEQPEGVADRIEIIPEENSGEEVEVVQTAAGQPWWGKMKEYAGDVNFLLLIYGIGAMVLLIRWVVAAMSIVRLRKWGSCYREDGCLIVKNNNVSSPFSFFRMIFINRKIEGEVLQVILAHERSHIEHKHYRDSLLMELFCMIFWFNPFVWLIRRELRALHEFEVDQSLLAGGLELSKYQNIIFNELMNYGPAIANGFHDSLIKKRFIMMKNSNTIRLRLLRKVLLLPVFAGVVALFAFTDRKTVGEEIQLPEISEMPEIQEVDWAYLPVTTTDSTEKLFVVQTNDSVNFFRIDGDRVPLNRSSYRGSEPLEKRDTVSGVRAPFKGREGITFYPLRDDQVVVSLLPFDFNRTIVRYIETDKNETRVTIATPIYFESNWVQFDKGFCMVDRKTGDTYVIRSLTRGIELDKTLVVEGKKNRMVEFTMVFPPLKQGVKSVDMYQKYPQQLQSPTNSGKPWMWKDLKLADYTPPKDRDLYYDKEGRPKQVRKVQYLELRDDQVVESSLPLTKETKIVSIVADKKKTSVTIATPVYFDRHWVQFDKGFCIEDCRSGDVYKIDSLTRGVEMNKTLIVVGKKNKMVEFTMVFPPLKKRVGKVRMYTKYLEESALAPSNGGGAWDWKNINITNYRKKEGQVYY